MGLSTDKIIQGAVNMVTRLHRSFPATHLDIGAGHGELIELLGSKHSIKSRACDYTDILLKIKNVPLDILNLNKDNLPYLENSFDLITCTEVVEHLENYRHVLREMHRVLKNGGTLVVTTPNILNLKSRFRFFFSGFYNLFGPLHFNESELHSAGGHITPISIFYLVHSLIDAGFKDIHITVDKRQSTSMVLLFVSWIPIKIINYFVKKREISRYRTIDKYNEPYFDIINSMDILLGRTLIVGCRKPSIS